MNGRFVVGRCLVDVGVAAAAVAGRTVPAAVAMDFHLLLQLIIHD